MAAATAPHKRTRPKPQLPPASVFGSLKTSPLAPLTTAQRAATVKVQRATRKVEKKVSLPAIPKLAHPTSTQRAAATQEVANSARKQGLLTGTKNGKGGVWDKTKTEALPKTQRQRVNRAQGYQRTQKRQVAQSIARAQLPKQVSRKMTGGQLAAAGRTLGRVNRSEAKPGPAPVKVQLAGIGPEINVTALGKALGSVTTLGQGDLGPRNLVKRSASDIGSLGSSPFVGGYEAYKGLTDLIAHGDPTRLKTLGKGVVKGFSQDALVQALEGVGAAATGDKSAAAKHFKAAGQQVGEHPVFSALDVAAAIDAPGAIAGATARGLGRDVTAGGVRGALARVGNTVRPPLALSEDAGALHEGGLIKERRYSKKSDRKAAQVAADAHREPVLNPDGSVLKVRQRGKLVPVLKASPGEVRRGLKARGDFEASRANATERMVRDQGSKAETKVTQGTTVGGVTFPQSLRTSSKRLGDELLSMFVEGTIKSPRTFVEDLAGHHANLEAAFKAYGDALARGEDSPFLHAGEVDANRDRSALVGRALSSDKVTKNARKLYDTAAEHSKLLNDYEREAIRLKILDPASARRSKLVVWAIDHMGAEHMTVEQHAKLEGRAAAIEDAARKRAEALPAGSGREAALRRVEELHKTTVAVSGRDPLLVADHERAVSTHRKAEATAKSAEAAVARLERSRQRLVGAQAVQRGHDHPRGAETNAEFRTRLRRDADRGGKLEKIDRLIARARAQATAARAEERAARLERAQHRLPDAHPALRKSDGSFLSNEDIEKDIEKHRGPGGVDTIAYLPHRLDVRGGRAHHTRFRPGTRPNLDNAGTRTGSAYRRGSTGFGRELIHDAAVHTLTQVAKTLNIDEGIGADTLRHPALAKARRGEPLTAAEKSIVAKGGAFTVKEATELATHIREDTSTRIRDNQGLTIMTIRGQEFVPVRMHNASLDAEAKRVIRDEAQNPRAMESLSQRLLNDRVVTPKEMSDLGSGARNVTLMPKTLYDRLNKHLAPAGDIQRFFQLTNRAFRMAVLPQPRWLTGNFIEPYLVRLPASGSGAINVFGMGLDIRAAKKTLASMERSGDPRQVAAAQFVRAQQLGGLFVSGGRGAVRRTLSEALPEGMEEAYGRLVQKLPAVATFADFSHRVLHTLAAPLRAFFHANKLIELGPQYASLGKSIRTDMREFTDSYISTVRLGDEAIKEAARGLVNTPTQQRYMREQHELLGKYEGYGPLQRQLIQTVVPFVPWAMSAARFIYWTMPAHHTILTSVLLKTQQVVNQEWAEQHSDVPPGGLQLAIPRKDGGYVDLARYTPYGLAEDVQGGNYTDLTNYITPQFSGAVGALGGHDPFGNDLVTSNGKVSGGQKIAIAVNQFLESVVPGLSTARRLREHGETSFADSTVLAPKTKPGTAHGMSAVDRTFNPFRPTYLRKPAAASTGPLGVSSSLQNALERRATSQPAVSPALQRALEATASDRGK